MKTYILKPLDGDDTESGIQINTVSDAITALAAILQAESDEKHSGWIDPEDLPLGVDTLDDIIDMSERWIDPDDLPGNLSDIDDIRAAVDELEEMRESMDQIQGITRNYL